MRLSLLLSCTLACALARPVCAQPLDSATAKAELQLADSWLAKATRVKGTNQRVEQWLAPLSLAGFAVAGSALMLAGEDDRTATRVGGSLSSLGLLAMAVPTALTEPVRRKHYAATGASLGLVGWGSTLWIASREPRPCPDDACIEPRTERFLGGSMIALGVALLGSWLLPEPPSLDELTKAQQLPDAQRVRATERLLLRFDRAQRVGSTWLMLSYLAGGAVLAGGALAGERGDDRNLLASFSALFAGEALLIAFTGLTQSNRLEQLVAGKPPGRFRGW